MTFARKETVDPSKQGTYHCWSRCVRRAFLCGFDALTGRNYDHRKAWVEKRLEQLVSIFAVDVLAYAIMDNHQHLAIRNYPGTARSWTAEEVARRWSMLFPKRRYKNGNPADPTKAELSAFTRNRTRVKVLRGRLSNISWFMRCLNENIARRANIEDEVTGRFWEGRFKCTRLDDLGATISCMVYIDLNPIRAGKAETPEESEFTSAFRRIAAAKSASRAKKAVKRKAAAKAAVKAAWLCPIEEISAKNGKPAFTLADYLLVLDQTGRELAENKPGAIPAAARPILERLSIKPDGWMVLARRFGRLFPRVAGSAERMRLAAESCGRRWFKGVSAAEQCL